MLADGEMVYTNNYTISKMKEKERERERERERESRRRSMSFVCELVEPLLLPLLFALSANSGVSCEVKSGSSEK